MCNWLSKAHTKAIIFLENKKVSWWRQKFSHACESTSQCKFSPWKPLAIRTARKLKEFQFMPYGNCAASNISAPKTTILWVKFMGNHRCILLVVSLSVFSLPYLTSSLSACHFHNNNEKKEGGTNIVPCHVSLCAPHKLRILRPHSHKISLYTINYMPNNKIHYPFRKKTR